MKVKISSLLLAATVWALAGSAAAQSEKECGSLKGAYGPFDYRTANDQQRHLVEDAHFTRGVETLTETKTGPFGGDIRYTLFVFPNHPRALMAMERLIDKEKLNPARDAKYTIECFYERAIRFRPEDHLVRMLYVNFLIKRNQLTEAQRHLDYVAESTQDNPLAQFNAGMLYIDMKLYDKALVQAHRVIEMGFDRRELRDRLTAVGKWVEPTPAAAGAASAPQAPQAPQAASAPEPASAPASGASR